MYRVVLLDDEKWALADVRHVFPFQKYGFEIVGQYTSATAALADIVSLQPDVLFVDIRMPVLSGLDFIRIVSEQLPDLVSIILSGYAEFGYAQSALRLKVFEYCLKPVEEEAAEALLQKLQLHLQQRGAPRASLTANEPDYNLSGNRNFSLLLKYVQEHIYERLVLDKLAKRFFINPSYCGQLFKSATGKPFSQYVRDIRLQRACELLEHTRMPITEIAQLTGYDNLHYFTRLFTAKYRLSPREYRNRAQSAQQTPQKGEEPCG